MDKELTNLSSNKKLRRPNDSLEDDDDVDRISDLPESVLSHILSRLPTTLDAVRTCVLSRKWEKQWKNVYNLRFSDYKVDKSKKKDFAISVQKRGKIGSRALLLLGGLSSVIRCLELSEYVIEALAHAEPPCSLPIFDGLTILKVSSTWSNTLCSGPLMELLNSAPALEKLIFTTLIDDVNYEESNSLPTNFSSNLKVVEFRLFKGRASEIQLVKFLLHNLSILEQLVITKFLGDTKVEVENQLLMLPRSSSRVSIVFL
ncbi:F-box/LRR-repeat protein At3g26922-like isoform X4 [Coffea eugenioides]|uniref:F-box/LRR-repeat protein At3g26922-like isoform X4 n=1 Tax=Coffea eugenioides TaxID=49369 RepID=UPI000F61089D|nr:F-box/LRR-repeat protein At3g26922-like isoform X4 [Coffea eugenioides]